MHIIRAELITLRNEPGGYIIYLFRNLDSNSWDTRYVMTTRFPNWDCPFLKKGDIGFLKYKEVEAGKSTWWNNNTQTNVAYKYDNVIFENFIHEKKIDSTVML